MNILLRLPRFGFRRWHGLLAEGLKAAGHSVSIAWDEAPRMPCPLDHLRALERRVFHVEAAAAGERIAAPGPFAEVSAVSGPPGLTFCCTGADPGDDPATLYPDFCGAPAEIGLGLDLLERREPTLAWRRGGDRAAVVAGRSALTSPHVITQGFDHACARLASLGVKAAALTAGSDPIADEGHSQITPAAPGSVRLLAHAGAEIVQRIAARLLGRRTADPLWNVGWRRIPESGGLLTSGVLGAAPFQWLPVNPNRFVADPFAFEHEGRTFVFVEELPFATWRGFISVFELDDAGTASPLRPVLERPYHLSYPSVFVENGAIWMIPETGANRTIELYRADPFPDRWVLDRVLIETIDAADATFFRHGGRCWLAAATADCGASSWDSLSLFHADSLFGPWKPHRLNPVLSDPARARPAGWVRQTPLGLIRPAQDCIGGYGAALALNRIEQLDPDTFKEQFVTRVAAPPSWKARGLHTVTQAGGYEVIDAIF